MFGFFLGGGVFFIFKKFFPYFLKFTMKIKNGAIELKFRSSLVEHTSE